MPRVHGADGSFVEGEVYEKTCRNCGITFVVPPRRKDTAKFCSHVCQGSHVRRTKSLYMVCEWCNDAFYFPPSQRKYGENGRFCGVSCYHNWQRAGAAYTRGFRDTEEYKMWRREVHLAYDYTCQHCGIRGGSLVAHHLLPMALYPECALDVDNGITLHRDCHWDVHRLVGTPKRKPGELRETVVLWSDTAILSQAVRVYLERKVQRLPDYRHRAPGSLV